MRLLLDLYKLIVFIIFLHSKILRGIRLKIILKIKLVLEFR